MKVLLQETHSQSSTTYKKFALLLVIPIVLTVVSLVWINIQYQGKYLPGVFIDELSVSGLSKTQARTKLEQTFTSFPETTVSLSYGLDSLSRSSNDLGLHKNYDNVIDQAFLDGRADSIFSNSIRIISNLFSKRRYFSQYQFNTDSLTQFVQEFNTVIEVPGVVPTATIVTAPTGKEIDISNGAIGSSIDIPQTVETIQSQVSPQNMDVVPSIITTGKIIDENTKKLGLERARKLLSAQLTLQADIDKSILNDALLVTFLNFPTGYQEKNIAEHLQTLGQQFDRAPQDAEFEYDTRTLEVKTFQPHLDGRKIGITENIQHIIGALEKLENSDSKAETIPLTFEKNAPTKTLADVNDLGITERIGFGESYYAHSIPTRIHNVSVASQRVNNHIVAPGEEFSFNKALGEVSRRTGFQPAYVISGGRTVLGDGGGVCQVSTTIFRALLDSGLKITRRLPHSYRVSYYEIGNEPGYDATVYSGNVDLRFVNDTDHHILLHLNTDSKNTYMNVQLFGTSDGRTTEIKDYQKWGARGAPANVYYDDPTLPAGKLIQVDWAVGGIKTKFTHVVKDKDGNVMSEKEYTSNYIPWSAKYRRGTGM